MEDHERREIDLAYQLFEQAATHLKAALAYDEAQRSYEKQKKDLPEEEKIFWFDISLPYNPLDIDNLEKQNDLNAFDGNIDTNGGINILPVKRKHGKGCVRKRERKNKKGVYVFYEGRYYIKEQRKQIYVTSKTQKDCVERLNDAIIAYFSSNKQNVDNVRKQPLTLSCWLKEWFSLYKEPNNKGSTNDLMLRHINVISNALGNILLSKLTTDVLQKFLTALPANNTRNKLHMLIKSSLKDAFNLKKIKSNPALAIRLKKVKSEKRKAFTFMQQREILASDLLPKYKALIFFLCCTGLRIGEFLALDENEDIDYNCMVIRVSKSMDRKTKQIISTKTGEIREVPFHHSLLDKTYDLNQSRIFFGCFQYEAIKTTLGRHFKIMGYENQLVHTARHTFASVCYYLKISDKQIQKWMGHATLSMTTDVYTELMGKGESPILNYLHLLKESMHL